MVGKIRFGMQVFGAVLAAVLLGFGVFYFNIILVISATISALFAGRLFCGWLCPMGFYTERLLSKFSLGKKAPRWIKSNTFKYLFALSFIIILILLSRVIPRQVFPFVMMGSVFLIASLLGIIYHGRFWCGNLCPWGVLSGLASKLSFYKYGISSECKGCKLCTKVCSVKDVIEPTIEKIRVSKEEGFAPLGENCIRCGECAFVCPVNAINFKEQEALSPWYRKSAAKEL